MIGWLRRKRAAAPMPTLAASIRHRWIGANGAGEAVDTARTRLLLAAGLFAIAFGAISLRLVDLTLLREGGEGGLPPRAAANVPRAERADIVDRNGVVLAVSLPTASLFANPRLVIDADEAARKLVKTLPDLTYDDVFAKLKGERNFIFLKRSLTPREQDAVNRLGIPGLDFQREERRVYPQGPVMAHIVGFAGVDNIGLAGIEKTFDARLRDGERIVLSIDVRLQRIVQEELQRAIEKFNAIGAAAIVLDIRTGELLAMVTMPTFDPNRPKAIDEQAKFNRATLGVYEMGSTFKIFNTAMALDTGKVTLASTFDATQPIKIASFTINDDHPQRRWLTVPELFKFSSNIASAKMATAMGGETQRDFFDRLGFLKPMAIELPESAQTLYPNPWRPINVMTIAFGHGMAVTPLHLATGVGTVINGGLLLQPTLMRKVDNAPPTGKRVIQQQTSNAMRGLMRLVVEEGTGKNAEVPGYMVGGKTGTSEKVGERGGYKKKALLTTFVGAFPMNDPRYVVLVSLDEPKPIKETQGYATAGWNAAPTVAKVIGRMVALYGIPPVTDPAGKPDPSKKPMVAPVPAPHGPTGQGGRNLASN